MEDIIAAIQEWEYLSQLPQRINGFTLRKELNQCDTLYWIFSYENCDQHRKFSVLYDSATKDFLARIVIGLTEYCDISFISSDIFKLENILAERMEQTIQGIAEFDVCNVDSICRAKKIMEWDFDKYLPKEVAGFQLFIKPSEPLKVLNGSYIVIDYSDFHTESNLIIYYNIFRDEFFGEIRVHRTPRMAAVFDCKSIEELAVKIESNLLMTLESVRQQLNGLQDGE